MFTIGTNRAKYFYLIDAGKTNETLATILKLKFNDKRQATLVSDEAVLANDLTTSLLLPIRIKKVLNEGRDKDIINADITNVKNIIQLHVAEQANYKEWSLRVPRKHTLIFGKHLGHWDVFLNYYGEIKETNDMTFMIVINGINYVVSKTNGKFRLADTETIEINYADAWPEVLQLKKKVFWQMLDLRGQRHYREIFAKDDGYYFYDGKSLPKKMTNWIGHFSGSFINDECKKCWTLVINNENLVFDPFFLSNAKRFQEKLVELGLYFFYGDDYQMKKLLETLAQTVPINEAQDEFNFEEATV